MTARMAKPFSGDDLALGRINPEVTKNFLDALLSIPSFKERTRILNILIAPWVFRLIFPARQKI